jgi:hypothetical protein
VASQVHPNLQVQPFNTALLRDAYAAADFAPCAPQSPALDQETEGLMEPREDGLGFVRGSLAALVLDGVAALFVYGIWQTWHFFRY